MYITYSVALGVLSKLVLDEYLSNMSKDLLFNCKAFLTKRKLNSGTLWRAVGIGNTLKYQINVDPQVTHTVLRTWRKILRTQSIARTAIVHARRL
jgi:hypothetical protein